MLVSERMDQEVDVVGHYHYSVEMDSVGVFAEAVFEDQGTSAVGERNAGSGAEGDKERGIVFLQMREPAAIAVFG